MSLTEHSLLIRSTTDNLDKVRAFVEKHAAAASFPPAAVENVKMAVDEACANVIEHAYGNETGHVIEISILTFDDRLVVRLRDQGKKFDQTTYEEPDLATFVRQKKSGGFGVHLMRKLMDEVEYRHLDGQNETLLIKYRDAS